MGKGQMAVVKLASQCLSTSLCFKWLWCCAGI